ncbi:MAG: hypothetical protein WCC06_10905 [Candidatus Aminicenantales bacterium]
MFSCLTRGFCPSGHAKRIEEWGEWILSWRHTCFSAHSKVRAKTSIETEQVGKYMIRALLSLERLSLDEKEIIPLNRMKRISRTQRHALSPAPQALPLL